MVSTIYEDSSMRVQYCSITSNEELKNVFPCRGNLSILRFSLEKSSEDKLIFSSIVINPLYLHSSCSNFLKSESYLFFSNCNFSCLLFEKEKGNLLSNGSFNEEIVTNCELNNITCVKKELLNDSSSSFANICILKNSEIVNVEGYIYDGIVNELTDKTK